MTEDECSNWLVGGNVTSTTSIHVIQGNGLYAGSPGEEWQRIGQNQATVLALLRRQGQVIMSANHGIYSWDRSTERWAQLHDETITEILTIAPLSGDPGVLAGCPYGVATAQRDERGAARWTFYFDHLSPDERYSNALLVDPNDESRWLVGTEAGLIVYSQDGAKTERSDLFETPVRALYYAQNRFWAGSDDRGIFHSADGLSWTEAGTGVDGAVYALAKVGDQLVAATGCGLVLGDGEATWQRLGPRMLFAAVAVDPQNPQCWLAGASPGGLWQTTDAGQTWRQINHFKHVRAVLAPEGDA
jgi:photosystem II stability/assembly factor-like uncharacterized protein